MSKTQRNAMKQTKLDAEEFKFALSQSLTYAPYLAGVLFFLTLLIYYLTLAPTVSGGDSGELITAAYRLGIPHPPGYPLYTLLAKLFTYIPFGSIAWRVNLFSAVCSSFAAAFLCLSVTRWAGNVWSGWVAGALFAFSPLVWSYSTVAEVFALNNLLCILIIYFLLQFIDTKLIRWLYLTALTMGLAVSNHHTSIFFSIPFGICVLIFIKRSQIKLSIGNIFLALSLFTGSALLPYFYLIWAGSHPSTINWGNISSLQTLIKHVMRSDYGTFQLASSATSNAAEASIFGNFSIYLKHLLPQILYAGFPIVLFEIFKGNKNKWNESRRIVFNSCLLSFISYQIVFNSLANLNLASPVALGVLSRFWMLPNILVSLWLGLGVNSLFSSVYLLRWKPMALPILAVSLTSLQIGLNYKQSDQSKNWALYHFGKAILSPLAPNSILVATGDIPRNIAIYLQFCENYRTDVRFLSHLLLTYPWYNQIVASAMPEIKLPGSHLLLGIDSFEDTIKPDLGYSTRKLIENNYEKSPVYGYALNLWNADKRFALVPVGLAHQIIPRTAAKALDIPQLIQHYKTAGLKLWDYSEAEPHSPSSWERDILRTYWEIAAQNEDYLNELSQL